MADTIHSTELSEFLIGLKKKLGGIFSPGRDIHIVRAPGRLEVMGGAAEEAGCLVLQQPLQQGTLVAVQKRTDDRILIRHLNLNPDRMITAEYHLKELFSPEKLQDFARRFIESKESGGQEWPLNVVGLLAILLTESMIPPLPFGFNLAIESALPGHRGIGSSASLQIAALIALKEIYPFAADQIRLAQICQDLEGKILGRPAGKAEILAGAVGQKNKLMACLCQPHKISHHEMSPEMQWIGFDSDVPRPVISQRYAECQAGLTMITRMMPPYLSKKGLAPLPGGYLANVTPDEWQKRFREIVPLRVTGAEARDLLQTQAEYREFIVPGKRYALRGYAEFAIAENDRAIRLLNLIENFRTSGDRTRLVDAGELLYQSHQDMARLCKLNHPKTDLIVDMVRALGPDKGFYGARCCAGGEGGAVAILTARGCEDAVKNLAAVYTAETSLTPAIFSGSSNGALTAGVSVYNFK